MIDNIVFISFWTYVILAENLEKNTSNIPQNFFPSQWIMAKKHYGNFSYKVNQ